MLTARVRLSIAALDFGFDLLAEIGFERITAHVELLTERTIESLASLHHANGNPVVRIYGPARHSDCGGTIAFNVLDRHGRTVPYWDVEDAARSAGVSFRGGCFCNPGASEAAFDLDSVATADCLTRLGADFTPERLKTCLGPNATVGAVRASIGLANNANDIARAIDVIARFRS
jgi:selenocysteine lyase/cysteine desulfurase